MTERSLRLYRKQDNVNIFKNIPEVDYKESWHAGGTGYLDGVSPDDDIFTTSPLVKFVDEWGRPAVAIKYTVTCPEGYEKENGEYAVTVFQRYTNSEFPWVFGGHFAHMEATVGTIDYLWVESLIINRHENFSHLVYDEVNIWECSNLDPSSLYWPKPFHDVGCIECSIDLVGKEVMEV